MAGASSAGASGAETSTAGANSAGAGSAGAGGTQLGGGAGAAPVEDMTCNDAPVVVGCGCSQDPTPPPEVWNCIACETLPSTSGSIGPEGGSFILRGPGVAWFKLTIPPNALAVPTKLRITRSVRPPVSLAPASDGYAIEPTGIEFAVPVSVTVPLNANQVSTGLYWSRDVCSEPVWVTGSAPGTDTVSGSITHSGVVFATSVVALP